VTSGRPWRSCSMLGCLLGETEHVERAGEKLREDPSCHSHGTFSRISCSRVGSVIVNRAHTVKVLVPSALLELLAALKAASPHAIWMVSKDTRGLNTGVHLKRSRTSHVSMLV